MVVTGNGTAGVIGIETAEEIGGTEIVETETAEIERGRENQGEVEASLVKGDLDINTNMTMTGVYMSSLFLSLNL